MTEPSSKTKSKRWLILALALIAGGGTAFWAVKKYQPGPIASQVTTEVNSEPSDEMDLGAGRPEASNKPNKPSHPMTQTQVRPTEDKGCFEITFQHQKMTSHEDGEACAEHKNKLTLPGKNIHPKSICLKVNGNAIRFSQKKSAGGTDILFDSVAGPRSVVSARFCVGGMICKQGCQISRDAFLDALGGADDFETGGGKEANWDVTDKSGKISKTEQDLDTELKDFKGEFAEKNGGSLEKVFAGWQDVGRETVCEKERSVASTR